MGAAFVITLREAFEASLILGIVYAYLEKVGARDGFRFVTWGGTVGLLLSVAMGIAVTFLSGPLLDLGPDIITVVVIFAAVGLLTWHAWWMQQHARLMKGQVQHRIDEARASNRLWVVGLIAFTGVFREGAETVLFLWGIMAQAEGAAGWSSVIGGVAGVALAAAIGWAIFHGGRHISLSRFFTVTTAFIMLLAAGLFATGVGRLQGLGLLPLSEPVWNTSWLLSDKSVAGGFLSGLIGYRSQPTVPELCVYAGYILVMGIVLFGRRAPTGIPLADPALLQRHELEAHPRAEPFPAAQRMPELGVLDCLGRGEIARGQRLHLSEPGEIQQAHLDLALAQLDPDQLERVRHSGPGAVDRWSR